MTMTTSELKLTIRDIILIVEWYYETDITTCKRRFAENVRARDAVVYIVKRYGLASDRVVADCLGIERSSVIAARHRIANRIEPIRGRVLDREFKEDLDKLETYAWGILT